MLKIFFFLLLIISFGLNINGQSLTGHWKRIKPATKEGVDWGDLEIRSDSTYHEYGDTSLRNKALDYPHEGGEWDGKWEHPDSTHFILWLTPKEDRGLPLRFTIVKLTKKKLILRYSFYKKRKKDDIFYLRL